MSPRQKGRVVRGALVMLAIWPALQIALVLAYDADPWKLAGWGMYSVPKRDTYVFIEVERSGRWEEVGEQALPRSARPSARRLALERSVSQRVLDPITAMVEQRSHGYLYTRP